MKKIKKSRIPEFKSYKEAAEFWDKHSSTEFLDELEEVHDMDFSGVKRLVSIRLPNNQIEVLKKLSKRYGIGYLTLVRMWVTERIHQEISKKSA